MFLYIMSWALKNCHQLLVIGAELEALGHRSEDSVSQEDWML